MIWMLTPEEEARFVGRYVVAENGCWTWTGHLDSDGYGIFYLRRLPRKAHRVGWYRFHGEIGAGLIVHHVCSNRSCVNPDHLQLMDVATHAFEGLGPTAINARKTHCKLGHPLDGQYLHRRSGRTQRYCKTCEKTKKRRLYRKWREENTLGV